MPKSARQPTRDDALRLARRAYLSGEPLDLGVMSSRLGVSRVTLYRWVGTKDDLLVETVWSLTSTSLRVAWDEVSDLDGPRVPALLGRHLRFVLEQPGAALVAGQRNERFMRLMTGAEHDYHRRLVAAIRDYVAQDLAEGRFETSLSLDELTSVTVRISDSYHYLPTIADRPPDPDAAERVLRQLYRPPRPTTS